MASGDADEKGKAILLMDEQGCKYQIVRDSVYGFYHLDPIPSREALVEFYQNQYYELIAQGNRAPEIRRLMAGGEEGERELDWLRSSLFCDVAYLLGHYGLNKHVVEVGCGTGDLLTYLKESGFSPVGIEPSLRAVKIASGLGIRIDECTLEEFVEHNTSERFGAAVFINVFEHVPDPVTFLRLAKRLLLPKGIVIIRVPNDFSEIQKAAHTAPRTRQWWISTPDHINYFNFESLRALLEDNGFEVLHMQGDFPIEFFLLMGEDYVSNPELGKECHHKRINFEANIPSELRRRIYTKLGEVNVGRDCMFAARLEER